MKIEFRIVLKQPLSLEDAGQIIFHVMDYAQEDSVIKSIAEVALNEDWTQEP